MLSLFPPKNLRDLVMSYPCHMKLTCAASDEALFREFGFHVVERRGGVITMEDPAAPDAHDGYLPWHALYHGSHGPGTQYDGAEFVCNGQAFASVRTGQKGGVIVHLQADGSVADSDLQEWLLFVALRSEVAAVLAELQSQREPSPLLPPFVELRAQAKMAAADDPWIMAMVEQSANEWLSSLQESLSRELTQIEKKQLIDAYRAGHFKSSPPSMNPDVPLALL